MKKLALLVPFLNTDYCMEIVTGVAEYFKDKTVKLVIAKTELPKNNTGLYDYQNWNLTELIRSEEFDAYIVGSALYAPSVEELNYYLANGDFPQKTNNANVAPAMPAPTAPNPYW